MILESTGGWYQKEEPVYSVLKYVQDAQGGHLGTIALFVRETSFSDVLANTEDIQNRQRNHTESCCCIVQQHFELLISAAPKQLPAGSQNDAGDHERIGEAPKAPSGCQPAGCQIAYEELRCSLWYYLKEN